MAFDIKAWLDRNVADEDVLGALDPLVIHAPLWNGNPPAEILVFLLAEQHGTWGAHVQRLLLDGWKFDFLRDVAVVQLEGARTVIFGGDGTPYLDATGMSSVRLWKKMDDDTQLILQIGTKWPSAKDAAAGVKGFFGQFEDGPLEMIAKYSTSFGSA